MNTDRDVLRELLNKESRRELPEFSPLLHARIMRNIQECEQPSTQRQWRLLPAWYGLAAAAVLAIGVSLWIFAASNTTRLAQPIVVNNPSVTSSPSQPLADTFDPEVTTVQNDIAQQGYAGLDDDAKNLVSYAMDQVDPLGN